MTMKLIFPASSNESVPRHDGSIFGSLRFASQEVVEEQWRCLVSEWNLKDPVVNPSFAPSRKTATRKRSHASSVSEESGGVGDKDVCPLIAKGSNTAFHQRLQLLRLILKFGDQPSRASLHFITQDVGDDSSGSALPHESIGCSPPNSSDTEPSETEYEVCCRVTQLMLLLLRLVARSDPSHHFYRELVKPINASEESMLALEEGASSDGRPQKLSLTWLYCHIEALTIELKDVWLQRASLVLKGSSAPSKSEWSALWKSVKNRVVAVVDNFEWSVLYELYLSFDNIPFTEDGGAVSGKTFTLPQQRGTTNYLSYLYAILKEFQEAMRQHCWPAQMLRSSCVSPSVRRLNNWCSSSTAEGNDEPTSPLGSGVAVVRLQKGVTVVLTKALYKLRAADSFNILRSKASKAPLSVVAAKLASKKITSATPIANYLLEGNAFENILARTWSGEYETLGLCRAMLDVKAAFIATFLQQDAGTSTERYSKADVLRLWDLWERALLASYHQYFSQLTSHGTTTHFDAPPKCMTKPFSTIGAADASIALPSVIDCLISGQQPSAALSATQQQVLRILYRLRHRDAKQSFLLPSFRSKLVDLASMELWVHSKSFASKKPGEAFNALRIFFDEVVDTCVMEHGPTDPCSTALAAIRSQLVPVAKEEGLI